MTRSNAFAPIQWAMSVPPILLPNGRVDDDAHHVLLVLATWAKPDGSGARPGLELLARKAYRSTESTARALDAIRAAGLISQTADLNGTAVWSLHLSVVSTGRTVLDERREAARVANAERQRRYRQARAAASTEESQPVDSPVDNSSRNGGQDRYVTGGKGVTRNGGEGRYVTVGKGVSNGLPTRYVTGDLPLQPQVTPAVTATYELPLNCQNNTPPSPPARDTDAEFAAFYAAYPKRTAKAAARKAWDKATKTADPVVILAGAQRYATEREGQDPKFTAYPASWLNAGRWDDEPQLGLRAVSGGYKPFQSPTDHSVYHEDF